MLIASLQILFEFYNVDFVLGLHPSKCESDLLYFFDTDSLGRCLDIYARILFFTFASVASM